MYTYIWKLLVKSEYILWNLRKMEHLAVVLLSPRIWLLFARYTCFFTNLYVYYVLLDIILCDKLHELHNFAEMC